MTCAHVISGGGSVRVQLSDETQYDATVVGYDSKTDIGVLKIKATGLKAAEFGDSDKLSVGETVYAIATPAERRLQARSQTVLYLRFLAP